MWLLSRLWTSLEFLKMMKTVLVVSKIFRARDNRPERW